MKQWWQSLERREQFFVGGLGVFLGVFLGYFLIVERLYDGARDYREKTAQAERDLAWMRGVAPQLKSQLAQSGGLKPGEQSLTVVVDRTRRVYNIDAKTTQQVGGDGLRVTLDDTAFDAIVEWLGDLRSNHGIAIEAATVRQKDVAGTTDARLTLRRP